VDLDTRHHPFREEPLGVVPFDEQRLFEIHETSSKAGVAKRGASFSQDEP